MKPVWSCLINFGSDASNLFAIALVAILQSTLRSVIGRQFVKSKKEPSYFGIRVMTPFLRDGKLICLVSLVETCNKMMSEKFEIKLTKLL